MEEYPVFTLDRAKIDFASLDPNDPAIGLRQQ